MSITPLGDRVLVDEIKTKSETEHGIVTPDTAVDNLPARGKVVATGGDVEEPADLIGQVVLFHKGQATDAGGDQFIVDREDLLAIETKEEPNG